MIISRIGRKSFKTRLLHGAILLTLSLGAVTMVYPFLLMISGSTKSAVDANTFDVWPGFLNDDVLLYQKHIEGIYNESITSAKTATGAECYTFDAFPMPDIASEALLIEWQRFLEQENPGSEYFSLGYTRTPISKTQPSNLRAFKKVMIERYDGDIDAFNRETGAEFAGWNSFFILPHERFTRRQIELNDSFNAFLDDFKMSTPLGERTYTSVPGYFRYQFLSARYGRDIDAYNQANGTTYTRFFEVPLPRRLSAVDRAGAVEWLDFVRTTVGLLWIRVDDTAAEDYRTFLKAKYVDVQNLNTRYQCAFATFADVTIPDTLPQSGLPASDWSMFLEGWKDPQVDILHQVKGEHLRIDCLEFRFQDALIKQFGDADRINTALGTDVETVASINLPQGAMHWKYFEAERSGIRKEFLVRNYITVVDYMILHGRGIFNTVVYCLLAIIAALTVNPMAAYAMSRYKLPSAYTLLMVMLLTMAFPPMVTQIPVFLMLRDFNMLNTFAALILPGLAHGYSIFLLKGFFDSLPRELYESADIDGANEWVMFWNITMTLSKPILAVIALQAFNAAYSNFMFALLICQDESMWTLMVWLYQLQQNSGPAVVYASLIIAAVPTFLVFLCCQNVIMRGIVVPVEK
ncbi:MAG: ABC-type glycerol-3-phosphate transport system permease component [Candidatus Promineifilaceae bacterium]|jgi:ABC-type glycerol-3-phosphate transport system permease component